MTHDALCAVKQGHTVVVFDFPSHGLVTVAFGEERLTVTLVEYIGAALHGTHDLTPIIKAIGSQRVAMALRRVAAC